MPPCAEVGARGARRALLDQRHADALLRQVDAQDLERRGQADGHGRRPAVAAAGRRERRGVRQRFDARLELDEGAEVGDARDAAGAHLADVVGRRRPSPTDRPAAASGRARSCCVASSTRSTLTVIWSPTATISPGLATRDQLISETCSRPWMPPPRSMKAPKSCTDATRPVRTAPGHDRLAQLRRLAPSARPRGAGGARRPGPCRRPCTR